MKITKKTVLVSLTLALLVSILSIIGLVSFASDLPLQNLFRQHCRTCGKIENSGHDPTSKPVFVRNLRTSVFDERILACFTSEYNMPKCHKMCVELGWNINKTTMREMTLRGGGDML